MVEVPTVSVVMPCYNAERYIRTAIESVLEQTFDDFELIMVVDSSTDGTGDIVREYAEKDSRIVPVFNEHNIGLTASLNKGIDVAQGEFVARMDADDISYPERFEKQVAYLRANPDVCMVATSRERIDEEGNIISAKSIAPGKEKLKEMMKVTCSVPHGSVMFRRKEVIQLGKYREGIHYAEDYDLWLRMIEKYNIDILPDILYEFRLTHESRSIKTSEEDKYYHDLVRQFAKERALYGSDSYQKHAAGAIPIETSEDHMEEMYHLHRGLEYMRSDFRRQARREFWRCARMRPSRLRYWLLLITTIVPMPLLGLIRKIWRGVQRDIS